MYNYCKTCCHDDGDIGFCDKCYYNHILEEKGVPPTEYEGEPKPITNADRIRSMSDEELARFMAHYDSITEVGEQLAYERWLDLLQKEARDE